MLSRSIKAQNDIKQYRRLLNIYLHFYLHVSRVLDSLRWKSWGWMESCVAVGDVSVTMVIVSAEPWDTSAGNTAAATRCFIFSSIWLKIGEKTDVLISFFAVSFCGLGASVFYTQVEYLTPPLDVNMVAGLLSSSVSFCCARVLYIVSWGIFLLTDMRCSAVIWLNLAFVMVYGWLYNQNLTVLCYGRPEGRALRDGVKVLRPTWRL